MRDYPIETLSTGLDLFYKLHDSVRGKRGMICRSLLFSSQQQRPMLRKGVDQKPSLVCSWLSVSEALLCMFFRCQRCQNTGFKTLCSIICAITAKRKTLYPQRDSCVQLYHTLRPSASGSITSLEVFLVSPLVYSQRIQCL